MIGSKDCQIYEFLYLCVVMSMNSYADKLALISLKNLYPWIVVFQPMDFISMSCLIDKIYQHLDLVIKEIDQICLKEYWSDEAGQ